tara:strand:- start:66 stop:410 length:345 start_codon:yes stop_codon:yes gene_type:complete
MAPLLPELVVPELNDKAPLTPLTPASLVLTTTEPVDFAVPAPLKSETAPPVAPVLAPPLRLADPPIDVVPVPAPPVSDAVPAVDDPADVDPAVIEANPPSPVFPLPTAMVMSPD